MKTPLFLALAAAALVAGCSNDSSKPAQSSATNSADGSVASAPADYLGALARSKQTADKTIDTASIDKAIQLFQVDKGRLPKDLNELVTEKFLPQIPKPPVGMKFNYDPSTGVVKVVPQ